MKEKKAYVEPTIKSIDMSATENGGGSIPPIDCLGVAPTQMPDS